LNTAIRAALTIRIREFAFSSCSRHINFDTSPVNIIKPPRLNKGDLIGLVSPASPPSKPEKIEMSVRYLEGLGYRTLVGANAAKEHGYLAGTDSERAEDFNAMARNPAVKAIFALRGGYGSPRILPLIDYAALRRRPKIVSGFSDITALQLALFKKCGLVTFSGPMPAVEFWDKPNPFTEENFWRLITSDKQIGVLPAPPGDALRVVRAGTAEGILLGGNLSLVAALCGTVFLPSFNDAVLVLEEVEEQPYRVDRMVTQLQLHLSGAGRRLKGLVLGKFTRCEPGDPKKPGLSTDAVLADFANSAGVPALSNFCYGHVPIKLTVPFGVRARILTQRSGRVELLESAVT
jgi:muramoyltetrapeptide carboxypeptidase